MLKYNIRGFCFVGKMRSGKDTCADLLKEVESNTPILVKKFADRLYNIQAFAQKEAGFEPAKDRKLLQWLGTEWARAKDSDVWVKLLVKDLEELNPESPLTVLVTDGRFQNELEALKQLGFYIIKIERPIFRRLLAGATNLYHASETSFSNFKDYNAVIVNQGDSLVELKGAVSTLLDCLDMNSNMQHKIITRKSRLNLRLRIKASLLWFRWVVIGYLWRL
jgi:hypothetical protein